MPATAPTLLKAEQSWAADLLWSSSTAAPPRSRTPLPKGVGEGEVNTSGKSWRFFKGKQGEGLGHSGLHC